MCCSRGHVQSRPPPALLSASSPALPARPIGRRTGAGAIAGALAREAEERRFFLWLPVAAMGGVALNLAADREPVLWLPALLAAVFLRARVRSRAQRPSRSALWLALAALSAGFLSMGLRTARVATPVLDHVRIVKLKGFVEEADLRPVGARLVIEVVDPGDMPADLAPRRVRVTTRKAPDVAAGDYRRPAGAAAAALARGAARRL